MTALTEAVINDEQLTVDAAEALGAIGPDARSVTPALLKIMNEKRSSGEPFWWIRDALVRIDPEAVALAEIELARWNLHAAHAILWAREELCRQADEAWLLHRQRFIDGHVSINDLGEPRRQRDFARAYCLLARRDVLELEQRLRGSSGVFPTDRTDLSSDARIGTEDLGELAHQRARAEKDADRRWKSYLAGDRDASIEAVFEARRVACDAWEREFKAIAQAHCNEVVPLR